MARLGLDSSGFATGLARAQTTAARAGAQMGNAMRNQFVAFFGTAAVAAAIKSVVDYGGKINDLSNRTFQSKTELQEFDYIAQQTGTSLEAFVNAEKKLAVAQQDALRGSKEQAELFEKFGFTMADLERLNPHQIFMLMSEAIRKSSLSGESMNAVIKLMGRSANELIPAMKEGFDGMIDRAHRLGLILSDEVITKLDEVGDRMNEAKLRMRAPAASAAMFGVEKVEELAAFAAGLKALWDKPIPSKGQSWKDVYTGGVDEYNQRVMDSSGSRSLIAEFEKQRRLLENIERNTKQAADGEGIPNVL